MTRRQDKAVAVDPVRLGGIKFQEPRPEHSCGIRQPHVSRYEAGKHEPGLLQADRMAQVLGVSLERLAQAVRRSADKLAA
jgi:hypothetical protein